MERSRFNEVDDWFARALERPASERAELLDRCPEDVRGRVLRLLEAASQSDELLKTGGVHPGLVLGERGAPYESVRRKLPVGTEILGRYRILGELGAGGMGLVLRALDLQLKREVAIKVVTGASLDRDRLLREARTAAALNHPNLVAVYDVGQVDDTPFVVMELVDGPTLEEQPPLTVDDAVRVALQVCRALAELHRRGIVHRDVKPGNLLAVKTGDALTVKLADLGLAHDRDQVRLTVEGGVLGTPSYMAPEQARGQTVDGRADLYALGVMLYLWVTGRLPFVDDDAMIVISQHVHAPVVSPRDLRADLAPELEEVIVRLLAKNPQQRYASADAVAEALSRIPGPDPDRTPRRPQTPFTDAALSLDRGRKALEQGDWTIAYEALSAASAAGELEPRDLSRLAAAAGWSGRYDEIVPLLEDANSAYTRAGDRRGAAAMACELANVYMERRQQARCTAWLRRAEKLLEDQEEGPEHAFAAWLRGRAQWESRQWETATAEAQRALDIAKRVGDHDREALALLDLGHLSLLAKRHDEAVALLDEAGGAALSGELGPRAAGTVLCGLIFAWRSRGNWARAAEWTQAQSRWCEREQIATFPGLCRIHRGELIRLRGDLGQAELDLAQGAEELVGVDNSVAAIGYRELGEVCLRRGKLNEAESAFRRALELGSDAQPGLARLRLVEGDAQEALRGLQVALNSREGNFLDEENRWYVLPVMVTAAVAAGDHQEAERAVVELEEAAQSLGAGAHNAAALAARGELLLAEGETRSAIERLQESWRAWCSIDAPYEAAQVKGLIARALAQEGDRRGARLELEAALAIFERLGARLDVARVREDLGGLAGLNEDTKEMSKRAWSFAQVVDVDRLQKALDDEAWHELEAWLQRTLERCCAAHAGVRTGSAEAPGAMTAWFGSLDDAVHCAIEMQTALKQHRSQHGFAPPMRVGVSDVSPDHAQELAECGGAGEVMTSQTGVSRSLWPTKGTERSDVFRVLWSSAS